MRINTNVAALSAFRNLNTVQDAVSNSMAKLSSGFRINKAADDAAGLGIANKLQADGRGYTQASRNAEQANSVLQVAEGGVNEIQKIVQRMKELATQAASDNTDDAGRGRIKAEFTQLQSEISAISSTTKFQGKALLDGSFGNTVADKAGGSTVIDPSTTHASGVDISNTAAGTYTIADTGNGKITIDDGNGKSETLDVSDSTSATSVTFDAFGITLNLNDYTTASKLLDGKAVKVNGGSGSFLVRSSGDYGSSGNDRVSLSSVDMSTTALGIDTGSISFTVNGTTDEWATALTAFDGALDKVNTALGNIGAAQNRISYALDNAQSSIQNFAAAESTIRDVDMAQEMTTFSKNQILAQAGTAMLAQANAMTSNVLTLLKG